MNFCSNCGKELAGDSSFCPNCGLRVVDIKETLEYKHGAKVVKEADDAD